MEEQIVYPNKKIQDIAEKLFPYFKDKPVNKAFLFGSYARETNKKDSDIDILLDLDYSKKIGLEFFSMQFEIEEILSKKIDLLTTKSISVHIKEYIEKDKILIYERSK